MDTIDTFGKVLNIDNEEVILEATIKTISGENIIEFSSPSMNVPRKIELILGEFTDIGKVTCVNNELSGIHSGEGGTRCKYKILYLFKGIHFKDVQSVRFDAAVFQINSLTDWFEIRTFKHDFFPINTVEFLNSETIGIRIKGFKDPKFIFSHDVNSGRYSFKANETIDLILPAEKAISIDDYYVIVTKLKKLFSFLTNTPFIIDDINLYQYAKVDGSENKSKISVKVRLYDKRVSIPSLPTSWFLNIKYIDIKENFPSLIENWLQFANDTIIIDLIMENAYNQDFSDKAYFINICFALEIFHKKYINDQKLSDEEFQEIKNYLRETVKNPLAKNWINNKLGLGNTPSFKDRLISFKDDFQQIYYTKAETLIERITHTRNYLVHSSSKPEYTIRDDFELFLVSITIETILKCLILKKLGIENENISKIFQTTKRHIQALRERRESQRLF